MNEQHNLDNPVSAPKNKEANQWAMFLHFSLLAGCFVPFLGLILPIVLWQIKKDEFPIIDQHGKNVVNWIISLLIYSVVCTILLIVLIGLVGFAILWLVALVFPIIAGIKANDGVVWEYPLAIKFLK